MAKFEKGHKGAKPKGSINKTTKTVKEAFVEAFGKLQLKKGVNLADWGQKNPTEFYRLCQKLIPTAIEAKIEGDINVEQVFKIGTTIIKL